MTDLIIRPAKETDLPRILEIYAPYIRNTTYSFEYEVPTPEAFLQRFRTITAFYPWLVAELDGIVVGYAYGSRMFERTAYSWDADTSIYVDENYHGMHIGTKLYAALEEELRKMGLFNLYAIVTGENDPSRAFHKKCGYIEEAKIDHTGYKFGRWLAVYWYRKQIREGEPEELPLPWPSL